MLWFGVLKQTNKKKGFLLLPQMKSPLRGVSRTPMYVLIFYTNWCRWTSIHSKWGTNDRPTKKWTHPSQAWWTNKLIWITCRSMSNSCLISGKSIIENSFASLKSPPKPGLWLTKAISLELPAGISAERRLYTQNQLFLLVWSWGEAFQNTTTWASKPGKLHELPELCKLHRFLSFLWDGIVQLREYDWIMRHYTLERGEKHHSLTKCWYDKRWLLKENWLIDDWLMIHGCLIDWATDRQFLGRVK